jgi:DNA modification methylase
MSKAIWYFKLFNSIKDPQEVEFAALELESLFGKVRIVRNFSDILDGTAFGPFKSLRVQDLLAHELPYGETHGFIGEQEPKRASILRLVRRLAYIREIFIASSGQLDIDVGVEGKNRQSFQVGDRYLVRYITNQYFLEKSQYISKLSRDETEIDRNVDALFSFLTTKSNRIPASSSLAVGKRLEDYFTIREEPSLYLTHYVHPYKGKFHPKLVRSLLNYVIPDDKALVLDNFAGSGTLLLEASWLGLDSLGTDINPLSTLTSVVKCTSLSLDPETLKKSIEVYLEKLDYLESESRLAGPGRTNTPSHSGSKTEPEFADLPKVVGKALTPSTIESILRARQIIKGIARGPIADFILIGLAGTISDLARRKGGDFVEVLRERLNDLYLRVYLFSMMNKTLEIKLGKSKTYQLDCRNMKRIRTGSVDGIINSPPYSTALDYVRNDLPQLTLLRLVDLPSLESNMIGNPNFKVYSDSLLQEIVEESQAYSTLPEQGKAVIKELVRGERQKEAIRSYRFFVDMDSVIGEMYRVLKSGRKCVMIVGNNNFKLASGDYLEIRNDQILENIGKLKGFRENRVIRRDLEKSLAGMIRKESVIILTK